MTNGSRGSRVQAAVPERTRGLPGESRMTTPNGAVATSWTPFTVEVCGGEVSYLRAGQGPAVLVLPRDNGHPPDTAFLDRLASDRTVYAPRYPGFHGGGEAEAWDWMGDVRDIAAVQLQFLRELGVGRVTALGLGFGGWVAAEMAVMSPGVFDALVLVAPMGIQPREAYIFDQFLVSTEAYARRAFADQSAFERIYGAEPDFDQLEAWETDREMTSRLAWKPYMYHPSLPRLLSGVDCPTLIAWGDADEVVPAECGEAYHAAIPRSTLRVIPGAGHAVDLEQPSALAGAIAEFLQSSRR
jgi:pimeloyl-ACP methyl ester carboxylesterase